VVGTIADEVGAGELRDWLLAQRSTVIGMGMTNVDLRELTPENAEAIVAAIRRARHRIPADWADHFALLADMVDAAERGESPMDLNPHMRAVLPPTDRRRGPGWDDYQS
jgi:hypothetical protein